MGKAEAEAEKLLALFDNLGEGVLSFDTDNTQMLKVINEFIEQLRTNLTKDKHIASGNLYQSLGDGWDIKILGKSAKIKISYDSKRVGVFNKNITITSNAKNDPIQLIIKGEVEPVVQEKPKE